MTAVDVVSDPGLSSGSSWRRSLLRHARRMLAGAAVVATLVGPLAVLTVQAFSQRWFYPQLLPRRWSLEPARSVLGQRGSLDAIMTGLTVSITVTMVAVAAAWPAARVLAGRSFRARGLVFAVLFLPSLLPPVGLAMGTQLVLLRAQLNGTTTAVVLAHLVPTLPYAVALLTAVFARHDAEQERQAALLGASLWQRFRLVSLPLAGRGVAIAACLVFLVSWSQYLLTLLAGGGQVVTVTMLLFSALAGGNPSTIGVFGLIAALPALVTITVAAAGLREGNGR